MSLLFNSRRITRAVAGELTGAEELALRAHLASCDACRTRYDVLTLAARVGKPDATGAEQERALSRLLEGLSAPAPGHTKKLAWVLVAAALGLMVFFIARPAPIEVQYRGGDAPMPFSVRVYAKGAAGPVRLVADLPTAGEARVTHGEWVQFKVVGATIVSGQHDDTPVRTFDLGQSVTLETGRWQLFIQTTPLAQRQPAGVLWVE